ncbi:MAG: prepilin peptidase [Beijerinckiaceae bacterium]
MLQATTVIFFPALMIYAAFSDLFTMTISNFISIALFVSFFALAVAFGLPLDEVGAHTACGLCVLAVTFLFFTRGWVGGGDAKLASVIALWLGFDHLFDFGLYVALLGGGLTLAILILRRWPLPSFLQALEWLARLHGRGNGVPYGIALALAGLILYPETAIWLSAASR